MDDSTLDKLTDFVSESEYQRRRTRLIDFVFHILIKIYYNNSNIFKFIHQILRRRKNDGIRNNLYNYDR